MGEKNYKLIYDIQQFIDNVDAKHRALNKAREEVEKAKLLLKKKTAELSGIPDKDLKESNVSCLARGIMRHVYHIVGSEGSGRNKCIFCGCDDFDD